MVTSIYDRFVHKYSRLPTENDPDYLEMLRMSKYRVKDIPDVNPGKCANCGSSKNDGRKYIDFGLQVDWYGVVFLCTLCLHDIALSAGLFQDSENRIASLVEDNKLLSNLKYEGTFLHETVVSLFKRFEEYYAGLSSIGDNNSSDYPTSMESENKTRLESGSNESKSGTAKSTTSSRRSNVRSLTDLLNESNE